MSLSFFNVYSWLNHQDFLPPPGSSAGTSITCGWASAASSTSTSHLSSRLSVARATETPSPMTPPA